MPRELTRVSALIFVLLLTAACGGRGEDAPPPTPTAVPTLAPTATPVPTPEPTLPVAPTAAPAASSGDAAPLGAVITVEDAAAINSYRLRVDLQSNTARGTDVVTITGAYVKEPLAIELAVAIQYGDRTDELGMVQVDGVGYMRFNDRWVQTPDAKLNIADLTLITAADVTGIVEKMELVGEETVNDRPSRHYRGGKELIPVVGAGGDTLDASQVDSAQLDVWVDTALGVMNRFTLAGSDTRDDGQTAQFNVTYDYYDFNADIVVTAPTSVLAPDAAPTGEFTPRNELGALVGFDLLMPTGSTVETVVEGALYVVVAPYTMDEATHLLETIFPANGYTQLSKTGPTDGKIVYRFLLEPRFISIMLEDAGNGMTRFTFATSPS